MYSSPRATLRPRRSDRNVMMRTSVALPRSGSPTHWEALARTPAVVSVLFRNQHSVGDHSPIPANDKAQRAVRQRLVLERQLLPRAHGGQELRPAGPADRWRGGG